MCFPLFCLYLILDFSCRIEQGEALCPIFSVPAVLRHDPTSSSILGSQDLATICDKANKESLALKRVFAQLRTAGQGSNLGRSHKAVTEAGQDREPSKFCLIFF